MTAHAYPPSCFVACASTCSIAIASFGRSSSPPLRVGSDAGTSGGARPLPSTSYAPFAPASWPRTRTWLGSPWSSNSLLRVAVQPRDSRREEAQAQACRFCCFVCGQGTLPYPEIRRRPIVFPSVFSAITVTLVKVTPGFVQARK